MTQRRWTYREWDEEARMKFLLGELTGKRPLMPPTLQTSAEQADVINTFRTIAQLPPDSLGAYVISMARSASDVLAVVLLQASSTSPTMPGCHATMPSCCHLPHSRSLLLFIALCHASMCQGCVYHMWPSSWGTTPVKCMPCSGQHCSDQHCQSNSHNRVIQPGESCLQITQPKVSCARTPSSAVVCPHT